MVARDVKVPCQLQQQHLQEHGREPMGAGHIRHFGDQLVQRTDGTLGAAPLRSGEMNEAEEFRPEPYVPLRFRGQERQAEA